MSLGPPFDASGLRLQQAVGAFVVLALAAAVAWVVLMSGRTLGRGVTIHVEMASAGALRVNAKVRLAGREIGEVRGATSKLDGPSRSVDFEVFVRREWAEHVHANSELFVDTPSVLGEAYLEVGPPPHGAAPGPAVRDGEHVHGLDPQEIDRFLAHSEANLRLILALMRDTRPDVDELLRAGDELLATLSGLPADRGQLGRIRDQIVAALDDGRALVGAVREADGVTKVRQIAADLGAIADRAAPELRTLGRRLDAALARLDELRALFSEPRRGQLAAAIASLRQSAARVEALVRAVRALVADVEHGRGTLGALLADQELFDDLHETHRIIKSQPWTLILKPERTLEPKKQPKSPAR